MLSDLFFKILYWRRTEYIFFLLMYKFLLHKAFPIYEKKKKKKIPGQNYKFSQRIIILVIFLNQNGIRMNC